MSNWKSFVDSITKQSRNYQASIDQHFRKNNGIYYTDFGLAEYLIREMFEINKISSKAVSNLTFFEPCVGIGIFVFAYIKYISAFLTKDDLKKSINNIFVADIDKEALALFVSNLKSLCSDILGIEFNEKDYFKNNVSSRLMFPTSSEVFDFYGLDSSFGGKYKDGFDIVVTNPPYKILKAEKNKLTSQESLEKEKKYYSNISKYAKKHFPYSNKGVLNIYKLFVEEIVKRYAKPKSFVLLLIPSTILTDKSCNKLRELIFNTSKCESVNCIKENNKLFDGTQALASVLLKKGDTTDTFRIDSDFEINAPHTYRKVDFANRSDKNNNAIVVLNDNDQNRLDELAKHPKVKELLFVHNKRGELDLTADSSSITSSTTKYRLLRGRDIGRFFVRKTYTDYVSESFVDSTPKKNFVIKERIACQQISNLNKERRLIFSYIPSNFVLGNSCNFISIEKNNYQIDIFYILGLMNSSVMNWFFKLKSSNNHVNNYEIDEFPIPLGPLNEIKEISKLVQSIIFNGASDLEIELDERCKRILLPGLVNEKRKRGDKNMREDKLLQRFVHDLSFFLKKEEIDVNTVKKMLDCNLGAGSLKILTSIPTDSLLKKAFVGTIEKYQRIRKYSLLNHIPFKLSELDLEMIACVPQGGSWKNIKPEIVKKSKRLMRIAETGGRTTLYGRIDYAQPSYTITTYFNRPGNGTYVHPIHDRVISPREAARFQSFSDDYYFYGSKTDLLDQIGNAVPPLMAKAIALRIKEKLNVKESLDLFVGAGGLTSGFEQAGIKSLCGVDFVENACVTLKINNPHIDVICGDLTLQETKDRIYKSLGKDRIDLIVGGPPCQGFSMAGKRFIDDPRNRLFKEYLSILKHLMPKAFLMENVDGMKSMQDGKVYAEILSSFTDAGYDVEGRLLLASEYGVPQKRKRLIIIGVRKDIGIKPSDLYPKKENCVVTARDAICDLENVPCSADATYPESCETSDYILGLRKNMN